MSLWGARCGKSARRVLRGEGGARCGASEAALYPPYRVPRAIVGGSRGGGGGWADSPIGAGVSPSRGDGGRTEADASGGGSARGLSYASHNEAKRPRPGVIQKGIR